LNSYIKHTRKYAANEIFESLHTSQCIISNILERFEQDSNGKLIVLAMYDVYNKVGPSHYGRFAKLLYMPGANSMGIKARCVLISSISFISIFIMNY
jgi:hypothetical protein